MLFKNLIRISGGRSADEVEDLPCDILRKANYRVVKLGLGYSDVLDGELRIGLRKPNLSCFGPENRKPKRDAGSYGRN